MKARDLVMILESWSIHAFGPCGPTRGRANSEGGLPQSEEGLSAGMTGSLSPGGSWRSGHIPNIDLTQAARPERVQHACSLFSDSGGRLLSSLRQGIQDLGGLEGSEECVRECLSSEPASLMCGAGGGGSGETEVLQVRGEARKCLFL